MDTAKGIGIVIANPDFADIRSLEGVAPTKNKSVPIFAVPTTAGTAAEVTINYVITDVEKNRKMVCVDPKDIPVVAFVDPEMMSSMPKGLTAATGMDALTHAIEGYITAAAWELSFVFIDCPPALGLLNTNALTSCDTVLIPVQCEYYALEGLTQLLNTIKLTQNHFNKKLSIEGLLLTMLDQRTNLGLEVSQEVRKYFKEKVYKTVIPRNIKLSEAPSAGICIFDYDGSSVGAQAYKELAKEVLSRNG